MHYPFHPLSPKDTLDIDTPDADASDPDTLDRARRRFLARGGALAVLAVPTALLAACGRPAPAPVVGPPNFSPVNPIRLHAASLRIQVDYVPVLEAPSIDARVPIPLADTAVLWAQARLLANGQGQNEAVMRFTRASVRETPLPRTGGAAGLFTRDQVSLVETDLIGELEIFGPPGGMRLGFAQAQVTRGRSLAEGITLDQRNYQINALVNETVTAFAASMEGKIRAEMQRFLARGSAG